MSKNIEQRLDSLEETLLAIRNVVNSGLAEVGRMKNSVQRRRKKTENEAVAELKAMILSGRVKPKPFSNQ